MDRSHRLTGVIVVVVVASAAGIGAATTSAHALYPPLDVDLRRDGTRLIVLGSRAFDPSQVDARSLDVFQKRPIGVSSKDMNGDGVADLVMTFAPGVRVLSYTDQGVVLGWLTNSQILLGVWS